jgi:hypothetical protein
VPSVIALIWVVEVLAGLGLLAMMTLVSRRNAGRRTA